MLSAPEHQIDHGIDAPVVLIPFDTDRGKIYVEVCMKLNNVPLTAIAPETKQPQEDKLGQTTV